jgi:hypothetical protein
MMTVVRVGDEPADGAEVMPTNQIDPLLARMHETAGAGGSRRSRLSVWMTKREAEITDLIRTCGADWEAWAVLWVDNGLLDAPKGWGAEGTAGATARRRAAETARQTWLRVRRRRQVGKGTSRLSVTPPQVGSLPVARSEGPPDPPLRPAVSQKPSGNEVMRELLVPNPEAGRRRLDVFLQELKERSR